MSGHSKWAGIKHKKALVDLKRGKLFSKLIKEITMAARLSGGDVNSNPRLRVAVQKAKEANMPSDNIDKAIKKGTGELPGVSYEEMILEGYGPGGIAILIEATTDNKNRTSSEIRHLFSRKGGNLAGAGSVSWMFKKKGFIIVNKERIEEDRLISIVLEASAEDLVTEQNHYEITASVSDFEKVKKSLLDNNVKSEVAELTMVPDVYKKLTGVEAKQAMDLVEALQEHDDAQNVYANLNIPDEILKEKESGK